MTDFRAQYLVEVAAQFAKLRGTAEPAMAQVGDGDFARPLDDQNNAIAVIVKHVSGNLRSRCTDFLTSDGEKPDRNRDGGFVLDSGDTRADLLEKWAPGGICWRTQSRDSPLKIFSEPSPSGASRRG